MKIIGLLAAAIITIFFFGCCPTVSDNPLSTTGEIDKSLEGVWKLDNEDPNVEEPDEEVYLHIGEHSENSMVILIVEHKENGTLSDLNVPFFTTKTDQNTYLNIRLDDLPEEISEDYKGYVFYKYVIVDVDVLLVHALNRKPVIDSIKEKKLKGKITYRDSYIDGETDSGSKTMEKKWIV